MSSSAEDDPVDYARSCPICFQEGVPLAKAPSCGHGFCIDCLKQFFALPPENGDQHKEEETPLSQEEEEEGPTLTQSSLHLLQERSVDNIATVGRCPLCRNPISLLTMIHANTGQPVWSNGRCTRLDRSPLAGKVFATRRGIGFNSFHFPPFSEADDAASTEEQEQQRPYMLWQDDKAHYPHDDNKQSDDHDDDDSDQQQLSRAPTKYYFEDCFYFSPKRTFHGTLTLPDSHGNPQQHDILFSFAENHSSINGGFMIRHPSRQPPPKQTQTQNIRHPLEGKWWVSWYRERPQSPVGTREADRLIFNQDYIHVEDNVIYDSVGMQYMLRYEPNRIYFHWPGFGVLQTLDPQCDFRNKKKDQESSNGNNNGNDSDDTIPAVSADIHWNTTDTQQPFISWKRETIELPPARDSATAGSVEYFGHSGGQDHLRNNNPMLSNLIGPSWYRELRPVSSAQLQRTTGGRPPYVANELCGNTFCQGRQVGLASYHFFTQETGSNSNEQRQTAPAYHAYISYESEKCSRWPPLDDGSPIPSQVYFHNITVEQVEHTIRSTPSPVAGEEDDKDSCTSGTSSTAETTTTTSHVVFRGTIEWLQDYSTTWQGHKRWEYEMQFDSQFTCIVSGTVHCVTASDERQEMSSYGSDLVYINAGIVGAFDLWMSQDSTADTQSSNSGAEESSGGDETTTEQLGTPQSGSDSFQRYKDLSRDLRRRLQEEGASVRTVAILNTVLTRSQQPGGESPIDYN